MTNITCIGLEDSLLEVCPVLCTHVQVLVLGKFTVRMPVTQEVWMNFIFSLFTQEIGPVFNNVMTIY